MPPPPPPWGFQPFEIEYCSLYALLPKMSSDVLLGIFLNEPLLHTCMGSWKTNVSGLQNTGTTHTRLWKRDTLHWRGYFHLTPHFLQQLPTQQSHTTAVHACTQSGRQAAHKEAIFLDSRNMNTMPAVM